MPRNGKIYVPRDKKLRVEVIQLYHDTPVGGHKGQWKMTELVTRNFWWPGVTKEVKKYIEECNICQRNKNYTEAPAGKLMPNAVPEKPWTHITVDFITKLPLAQEYNSILVVCNRLTKMAYFVPTTEKTSAEGVARLFQDNTWKLHGLPESIIMDEGVQNDEMRKKGKFEKAEEFTTRMKEVHKEAEAVLRKSQKKIRKYADRKRNKPEEYKVGDWVLLSTKDLKYQI